MSTNGVPPYWTPPISDKVTASETAIHLRQLYLTQNQLNQAIIQLKTGSSTSTTTVNETLLATSGTSGGRTSTGVTSFNTETGAVTFFPDMFLVNNQTGNTSYTTQNQDNGALVVLDDSSAIAVGLNYTVSTNWASWIANYGLGTATLTPTNVPSGITSTITYPLNVGSSSMPLPSGYAAFVAFDGINFWAISFPIQGITSAVTSLNGETGAVTLTSTGGTISITPSGQTIDLEAVSGAGGINQLTGDVVAGPGTGSQVATVEGIQTVPVDATPPLDAQILQYSQATGKWEPADLFAGASGLLYLDSTSSDIATYHTLLPSFPTNPQTTYSASGNNGSGQVLVAAFASPSTGVGTTVIPAGDWVSAMYLAVDALTQSPQAVVKIYTRTSAGVETLQITQTINLSATGVTLYEPASSVADVPVNPTDRIVVKVYLQAGGSSTRTLTLYVDGTVNNSHLHIPLSGINLIRTEYVNAQTGTTYTVQPSDRAYAITFSNTSPVAVTLPQTGSSFPNGWFADFINENTGVVTITPTTSTIDGLTSLALNQYDGIRVISNGTNYVTVRGKSSGSASGVTSLNSLTGALNLVAGTNITITPSGTNITIDAASSAYSLGGSVSSSNVAFGPAAGTGASVVTCSGLDGNHQIKFTTGTGTTATGAILTFTFTTSRGHNTYPVISFAQSFIPTTFPYVSGGSAIVYILNANGNALSPSTTYWVYVSAP